MEWNMEWNVELNIEWNKMVLSNYITNHPNLNEIIVMVVTLVLLQTC